MQKLAEQAVATCTEAFKHDPTEATQNALEKAETHSKNVHERAPLYEKLFSQPLSWRKPAEHQGGSFFGHGYWSNFAALIEQIIPELYKSKHEDVLQAVLGCVTAEDCAFARQVQRGLESLGVRTKVWQSVEFYGEMDFVSGVQIGEGLERPLYSRSKCLFAHPFS